MNVCKIAMAYSMDNALIKRMELLFVCVNKTILIEIVDIQSVILILLKKFNCKFNHYNGNTFSLTIKFPIKTY